MSPAQNYLIRTIDNGFVSIVRHVGQNSTSTTPISNDWAQSPPDEKRTTDVNSPGFANEANYEQAARGLQTQNNARVLGTAPSGDERFFIAGKDLLNAPTPVSSSQVANYNSPYDGSSTHMSQYGPSPDYHTPSHSVPSAGSPGVFRSPAAAAPSHPDYTHESPHDSYDAVHERPAKRRAQYPKSNYPLDDVQEACLLRYFIEVIAPWVCHMQYVYASSRTILAATQLTFLINKQVRSLR